MCFACVTVYRMYVTAHESQKRSDSLELDLVMSHHTALETEPRSSEGSQCSNC